MVSWPKLCFKMIMAHGVGSKNLKAVAECLDIVAVYVKDNGVDSITKKDFAIFLEKANSSDKNVRENTLRVFAETYKVLREDVWRLLGKDINGKVKGLLEQRFKQTGVGMGDSTAKSGGLGASSGGMATPPPTRVSSRTCPLPSPPLSCFLPPPSSKK